MDLRGEARRLRVEEGLSVAQICARLEVKRASVRLWTEDLPLPEWVRRPTAKDELREQAVELRRQGRSVPSIAAELGVARSTAFQWTRDVPREGRQEAIARRKAHSKRMTDSRWGPHRQESSEERAALLARAVTEVGELSERDLLLVGAAIYWAEGSKVKPWRPSSWVVSLINSDVAMIRLYLSFLEVLGCDREELAFRLSIHEVADVDAALAWWREQLGLSPTELSSVTLKRHNVATQRHNAGDDYHGCLIVRVRRPRRVYWRIDGLIKALIGGSNGDAVRQGAKLASNSDSGG